METNRPHPKNVPGPFYIVDGCCVSCMTPHAVAPDLLGFDEEEHHCFVKQQPSTAEEVDLAIRAVWHSEVRCLRYAGQDPLILRRLAEIGEASVADHAPPDETTSILRNYVTFEALGVASVWDLVTTVRRELQSRAFRYCDLRTTKLAADGDQIRFAISWYGEEYHPLWVGPGEPGTGRWLIHHSPVPTVGSMSVSLSLNDWLQADPIYTEIRWYTVEQWEGRTGEWQELPY